MRNISKTVATAAFVLCVGSASAAELMPEGKATEIAFKHASVDASSVTVAAFSLINKDGKAAYDMIFDTSDTGYHCVLDAETGEILEYKSHKRDGVQPDAVSSATGKPRPTAPQKGSSVYDGEHIGADRAKSIALSHAGVEESATRKLKIKKDREYGRTVYEVEFKVGGWEYDYDIDAVTGDILQWHREVDD